MNIYQHIRNSLRVLGYIYKLTDVSHNDTRRYSANILLPENVDIIQTIKDITGYLRNLDKFPVQVISLFVYTFEGDIEYVNWVCRSQWIDDDLEVKPNKLEGRDIGDGIIVDWR